MEFEYLTELEKTNLNKIKNTIEIVKSKIQEPTTKTILFFLKYIKNYIKKQKKIVYGGMAIDTLLKNKNDKGIYDLTKETLVVSDIPDIEFYSFDPIKDCVQICNELYYLGISAIRGAEAIHEETYTVNLFHVQICDISYISKNLYNNLPVVIVDEIRYVEPDFFFIDIYRQRADPLNSYFKIDKVYNRQKLIDTVYPLKDTSCNFNKINSKNIEILKLLETEYIINNKKIIVLGDYLLDYYIRLCEFKEKVKVKSFEIISFDLVSDIKEIQKILANNISDIEYIEYTPFFQFLGTSVDILYKGKLIIKIFSNFNKCIPVQQLSAVPSPNYVMENSNVKWLQFCSFEQQILHYYILLSKNKIYKTNKEDKVYCKLKLLIRLKDFYLKKYNLTKFDKSPFKMFNINCKGIVKDPRVILHYRLMDKLKKKTRLYKKKTK